MFRLASREKTWSAERPCSKRPPTSSLTSRNLVKAFHCLLNGRYDFMVLIATLLEKIGRPCLQLRMATLSYGRRNIEEICRLIDDGLVLPRLTALRRSFREKATREYGEHATSWPNGAEATSWQRHGATPRSPAWNSDPMQTGH